jgi:hypothetical protein
MPGAHRDSDSRACNAVTTVENQSTVYVNSKLWAVEGDPNSHGAGNLIAEFGAKNVYIEGKKIIVALGDDAEGDNQEHPKGTTKPTSSSGNVFAYG